MQGIMLFSLVFILVIASVWDLRNKKIPNALILLGLISGLIFSYIDFGFKGLGISLLSILLTFLIFIITWGVLGAGDIKILMIIGSFGGVGLAFTVGLYSIILGGFIFLFLISFKKTITMFRDVLYLIYYKIPILVSKNQKHIPFAPIILITFLLFK